MLTAGVTVPTIDAAICSTWGHGGASGGPGGRLHLRGHLVRHRVRRLRPRRVLPPESWFYKWRDRPPAPRALVGRLADHERVFRLDVVAGQSRQVNVEQVDDLDLRVPAM